MKTLLSLVILGIFLAPSVKAQENPTQPAFVKLGECGPLPVPFEEGATAMIQIYSLPPIANAQVDGYLGVVFTKADGTVINPPEGEEIGHVPSKVRLNEEAKTVTVAPAEDLENSVTIPLDQPNAVVDDNNGGTMTCTVSLPK